MNISQIARNQGMMYNIINRSLSSTGSASQKKAQSGSESQLKDASSENQKLSGPDSLLQELSINSLMGRTVREIAQYKMQQRTQAAETTQAAEANQAAQQSGDIQDLQSLQSQLGIRSQYTPISDEATKSMQDLAMKDALSSIGEDTAPSQRERSSLIQEQLKSVSPSKRLGAFNSMNKVWQNEVDRIGSYIKEKDPSWNTWGDSFDKSILQDYKPGINIFV